MNDIFYFCPETIQLTVMWGLYHKTYNGRNYVAIGSQNHREILLLVAYDRKKFIILATAAYIIKLFMAVINSVVQ